MTRLPACACACLLPDQVSRSFCSMSSVVICTLGTRGDVEPFLALAASLRSRGHTITFLSNKNWQEPAEACGANFFAIAPEDLPQDARDEFSFYRNCVLPSFEISLRAISQLAENGKRPIVVFRLGMLGAQWAAEELGLPAVKVALQPGLIRSVDRPSLPFAMLVRGRFGALTRRVLLPVVYFVGGLGRRSVLNRDRRAMNLPPLRVRDVGRWEDRDLAALLCPPWFAMPQGDWPQNCLCVGFPFFDSASTNAEVDAFMATHGAPLVFTPGTGIQDPSEFFRTAERVAEALNLPALLVSPRARSESRYSPTLCVSWLNFGSVLPRAKALIHHGGIGTTAQALRAGIPQVILPMRFDQPDNAERISELKLGLAGKNMAIDHEQLATLVKTVLNDAEVQQRIARAAADIRGTDAIAKLVELVERRA
jgi:rhamnosyltransferase subunit B